MIRKIIEYLRREELKIRLKRKVTNLSIKEYSSFNYDEVDLSPEELHEIENQWSRLKPTIKEFFTPPQ